LQTDKKHKMSATNDETDLISRGKTEKIVKTKIRRKKLCTRSFLENVVENHEAFEYLMNLWLA
jgi:hypothetical protein